MVVAYKLFWGSVKAITIDDNNIFRGPEVFRGFFIPPICRGGAFEN